MRPHTLLVAHKPHDTETCRGPFDSEEAAAIRAGLPCIDNKMMPWNVGGMQRDENLGPSFHLLQIVQGSQPPVRCHPPILVIKHSISAPHTTQQDSKITEDHHWAFLSTYLTVYPLSPQNDHRFCLDRNCQHDSVAC